MESLGEALRGIRKGLRKTTTEFAKDLGVTASAISQWERGKTVPSDRTLATLLLTQKLADTEKATVLRAFCERIGIENTVSIADAELFRRLDHWMGNALLKLAITPENAASVLREEVSWLLKHDDEYPVDPVIARILRFWRHHVGNPDAVSVFREAAAFLDVRLNVLHHQASSAREDSVPSSRRRAEKG